MPTFYLDDKPVEFQEGQTILQAAMAAGTEIPHYCYHDALSVVATCRQCLVDITDLGNGKGLPKLATSCSTQAAAGMKVSSTNQKVRDGQNIINELLLVNHPLDCPICDQSGECDLQNYAFRYGTGHSEMAYEKRTYGWRDVGTFIMLERNRCIHCSRCERFSMEIEGHHDFGHFLRTHELTFDTYKDHQITHKFQGNLADLCPVGAITEREFRFKKRAWKLERTPSVCPGCSTGCNITVDHNDGKVERLKPRENKDVNQWWMCDEGRLTYRKANDKTLRLTEPLARVKGALVPAAWNALLEAVAGKVKDLSASGDQVVAVADLDSTLEELFLLKNLLAGAFGSGQFFAPHAPESAAPAGARFLETLITPDKTPNAQGAKLLGFQSEAGNKGMEKALGKAKVVFVLGAPEASPALLNAARKAELVVQVAAYRSEWFDMADVILPALTWTEKYGTWANKQRRVQALRQAVNGPGEARDPLRILPDLMRALGQEASFAPAPDVLDRLAKGEKKFAGVSWKVVGQQGFTLA
ncbi:MAG: molybdopterin-dependent oxidoreductase [Deltaproteobacteria bacterium]|nr:molybdopterin-dependent oxidoreductase [Deltaproteobacteria bacterium]